MAPIFLSLYWRKNTTLYAITFVKFWETDTSKDTEREKEQVKEREREREKESERETDNKDRLTQKQKTDRQKTKVIKDRETNVKINK